MKQMKTMLAAFSLLIAVSSCNKEVDTILPPPPTPADAKLVKIQWTGTPQVCIYSYNAAGRLSNFEDMYFDTKYIYAPGSLTVNMFENGNVPFGDLVNITFANNRITSFGFGMYNNGLPSDDPELNSFQYDANGYLLSKSYRSHLYEYTTVDGNIVNMKETDSFDGEVTNTFVEYYTDKPNKLNINLFEHWYFDQYTVDQELFGKKMANLPKKVTGYYGTRELSYVINEVGLPTQIIIKATSNTGVVSTETLKLTYQ